MSIESERLTLRNIIHEDLEPLRQMRNDPTTRRWLTYNREISPEEQEDWFFRILKDPDKLYMKVEDREGNLVGLIRSDEWDRDNRSVRIGLDIVPEHRGKGYGTEAFKTFTNYCFEEEKMHRVWLLVAEENNVAIKLYKTIGFKEEGRQKDALCRDGRWYDYISMSILEDNWHGLEKT